MSAVSPALWSLARELVSEGRCDEAAHLIGALDRPADPAALAVLAALRAAEDRTDEAAELALAALDVRPLPTRLLSGLVDTLARCHRHDAADAALAALLEAGEPGRELHAARARLAERRARPDLAALHWQRALALATDPAEAQLGLLRALRQDGRFDAAELLAATLLERMPDEPKVWVEHARIAVDGDDPVAAESRWHAALLRHPREPAMALGLAQTLTAQHRFREARDLLQGLVAAAPDHPEPRIALVRTALAERDADGADEFLAAARTACPRARELDLLRGQLLELRLQHRAALAWYRDLASQVGAATETILALGAAALRQFDVDEAREAYQRILTRDADHAAALLGRAACHAKLGEAAPAAADAARALALRPSDGRVHVRRAEILEGVGQLGAARTALLEARSALPHRREPLLALAGFALRHGDLQMGAAHVRSLSTAFPRSRSARLMACDVALAGGDDTSAREMASRLAEDLPADREVRARLARLAWSDGAVARARRHAAAADRFDPRLSRPATVPARIDRHPLPDAAGEIRAFLLVRNELARLPWLLAYYRGLKVDRFLFLDNGSDDGTREWLLDQGPDVHVFAAAGSFAGSAAGMQWVNALLDEHGVGAWCLTVDADEALVYPGCEHAGLPALVRYLEATGAEAMLAIMIDMYAEGPVDRVRYRPGDSLIDAFPWFDGEGYVRRDSSEFPFVRIVGGCRARCFHGAVDAAPILQKVPLIKWQRDIKYTSSKHTAFPCALGDVTGALLHFKYLPDFADHVAREAQRGEHYLGGAEYRGYRHRLEHDEPLVLMSPISRRYRDSEQLVELGLIERPARFAALA